MTGMNRVYDEKVANTGTLVCTIKSKYTWTHMILKFTQFCKSPAKDYRDLEKSQS